MRIGFIGGNGHHYLRTAVTPADQTYLTHDHTDPAAAKSWHERMQPSATAVDSPEALLDLKPDVISVGAVYGKNNDFVLAALSRGIPVVSDKPLATTFEQLERLKAVVSQPGCPPLITEFDMRCRPEFASAREAYRRGLIGSVVLATGQKSYRWGNRPQWYKDRSLYGGTVLWVASHAIDAIVYTTGLDLIPTGGASGNISHPEYGSVEDHTVSLFRLGTSAAAAVHADYLRPAAAPTHGDDRLRLAGTLGVLEVRDAKCMLITSTEGPQEITNMASPPPVGQAMLEAALGKSNEYYSTAHSLALAELLLKTREATDRGMA